MALMAVGIAIAEAVAEAIAAAETVAAAAGATETLVGESAIFGSSATEMGTAVGNTALRASAGGAFVADPLSATLSYGMQSMAPTAMEAVGNVGARAGSAMAEYAFSGTELGASEMGREGFIHGLGSTVGRGVARGAVTGIPARLTERQARHGYAAFREHAARHGVENPYRDAQDFADHHHTGRGPFSPPRTPQRPALPVPGVPQTPGESLNFETGHSRKNFSPVSHTMVRPGTMNSFPKRKNHRLKWASVAPTSSTGSVANVCIAQKVKLSRVENPGEDLVPTDVHEPLGFTQMSAIYSRYAVREAVIRVDYVNKSPSDSSPDPIVFGLALKDDTTTLPNYGYYEELDHSTWHIVPAEGVGTIYLRVKPYEFFGIPGKQIYSDNDYIQTIGAGTDNVNTLYAHIFYHRMNKTSVVEETVEFNVAVHYDVTFLEPKDVAQS